MPEAALQVIEYNVTNAAIAELKTKYKDMSADTPAEYQEVKEGIAEIRTLRGNVESRRKELKQESLEYGRKVDSIAKGIIEKLLEVEGPLKLTKKTVDDEKERIRAEKARIEQERIAGITAAIDAIKATSIALAGATLKEMQEGLKNLGSIEVTAEKYEEYELSANLAKEAAIQSVNDLIKNKEIKEAEEQAQKDALAAQQKANEEAAAKVKKEKAELDKAKAAQKKIDDEAAKKLADEKLAFEEEKAALAKEKADLAAKAEKEAKKAVEVKEICNKKHVPKKPKEEDQAIKPFSILLEYKKREDINKFIDEILQPLIDVDDNKDLPIRCVIWSSSNEFSE